MVVQVTLGPARDGTCDNKTNKSKNSSLMSNFSQLQSPSNQYFVCFLVTATNAQPAERSSILICKCRNEPEAISPLSASPKSQFALMQNLSINSGNKRASITIVQCSQKHVGQDKVTVTQLPAATSSTASEPSHDG